MASARSLERSEEARHDGLRAVSFMESPGSATRISARFIKTLIARRMLVPKAKAVKRRSVRDGMGGVAAAKLFADAGVLRAHFIQKEWWLRSQEWLPHAMRLVMVRCVIQCRLECASFVCFLEVTSVSNRTRCRLEMHSVANLRE